MEATANHLKQELVAYSLVIDHSHLFVDGLVRVVVPRADARVCGVESLKLYGSLAGILELFEPFFGDLPLF